MRLKNLELRDVKSEENSEFATGIGVKEDFDGGSGDLGVSGAIVRLETSTLQNQIRNFTTNSEIHHDQSQDHDEIGEENNDEIENNDNLEEDLCQLIEDIPETIFRVLKREAKK